MVSKSTYFKICIYTNIFHTIFSAVAKYYIAITQKNLQGLPVLRATIYLMHIWYFGLCKDEVLFVENSVIY